MEKRKQRKKLLASLQSHSEALRTTFQLLEEPASSALERVPWEDVKKLAERVSKEATTTGMLWTGSPTLLEETEKLESYVNELQGFVLLCHGTTVGAGPTLHSVVRRNCKQVLESSLTLLQDALTIEHQAVRHEKLPPLAGLVWEACDAVAKAPADNRTAVGRAIVQLGVSMKDVLRELNELELEEGTADDGSASEADSVIDALRLDVKLSSSEMEVAQAVKEIISSVLVAVRQVLHVVSKLQENAAKVQSLEKTLVHVKSIGNEVDEIGASVFMQELDEVKESSQKLDDAVTLLSSEVAVLHGCLPEAFASACDKVHGAHVALVDKLASVKMTEDLHDLKLS